MTDMFLSIIVHAVPKETIALSMSSSRQCAGFYFLINCPGALAFKERKGTQTNRWNRTQVDREVKQTPYNQDTSLFQMCISKDTNV